MDMETEYLTAEQAAAKLQMHPRTVRRLLAQGKIPGTKIGLRQWRISDAALREYIEKPTQPKA
jgi:excisionase family DNA binding protein